MNEDTVSVGSAYLLSTLGEHLGDFVTWLEEQGINLLNLSVAGLKELMKQFKHKDDEPTEEIDYEIHLNSIGCKECRAAYREKLIEYFSAKKENLCDFPFSRGSSPPRN